MTKIKKGTSDYMRKTPRVLALEASKKSKQQQTQNAAKVAVSRRIPKVKMLQEVEDALLCWKSQQEEGTINQETPLSGKAILSSDHCKPDKNVLEFVIDTLQRKDNNEFFAEPVDGDEVEEYYDYIKNPMDFGTMRAKLHEGIYTTLKQFQDDVYLISNNAMTFNASSTVYYQEVNIAYESGKIISIIDDKMGSYPSECVEKFVSLALKCCLEETDARPSMAEVVRELEIIWTMMPDSDTKITGSSLAPPSSSSSSSQTNNPYVDMSGSDLVSGVVPTINPR